MCEETTIIYKKDAGPITIEITTGYSTLGSYSIAYDLNDKTTKVGNGKLGDAIPDIYILPISIDDLANCNVYIIGNYVPSPGHDQIDVEYNFLQKGVKLGGDNPIIIKVKQSSISSNHSCAFQPA